MPDTMTDCTTSELTVSPAPKPLKPKYRTRIEGVSYLRGRGYPISFSTMTKLCALGEGPRVARYFGRRPLYEDPDLDEWAESRMRPRKASSPDQAA